MHENLTRDGHEDLTSAAAAIDLDAGRQTSGVFATAQQQVSDIFVGDFAASDAFSVAQYMKNPRGRVLVLDYPSRQAETAGPLFKFLLDRSIALGMDDPARRAFYLLDEVDTCRSHSRSSENSSTSERRQLSGDNLASVRGATL